MELQTSLLAQVLVDCCEASREASEARHSELAALIGCLGSRDNDCLAQIEQQADDFLALADRLAERQTQIAEGSQSLSTAEKHELLDDLRQVLAALRVAAFEIGLHGRGAGMTDCEITDELAKYARIDCQLRVRIIPPLKDELGVTDTVAI